MKNLVHTSIKIISLNYNRGTSNRGSLISTYNDYLLFVNKSHLLSL